MTVSIWRDLITAILSVYQYSLEKVDQVADKLGQNGLFDPEQLMSFTHEDIFMRLDKSGYKRGNLNAIFTERLLNLGEFIKSESPEKIEHILSNSSKSKISSYIQPIKGVGPKVIENYFLLREK